MTQCRPRSPHSRDEPKKSRRNNSLRVLTHSPIVDLGLHISVVVLRCQLYRFARSPLTSHLGLRCLNSNPDHVWSME